MSEHLSTFWILFFFFVFILSVSFLPLLVLDYHPTLYVVLTVTGIYTVSRDCLSELIFRQVARNGRYSHVAKDVIASREKEETLSRLWFP